MHLNGMSGEVLGRDSRHEDRWVVGLAMGAAPLLSKNLRVSELQTCKKGHDMVLSSRTDGDYNTGWACDECCAFSEGSPLRWHCEVCKSDTCFACLPHPESDIGAHLAGTFAEGYAPKEEQRSASESNPPLILLDSTAPPDEVLEQNRELMRLLQKTKTKLEEQRRVSEESRTQLEGTRQACDALRTQLRDASSLTSLDLHMLSPSPSPSPHPRSRSSCGTPLSATSAPTQRGGVSSIFKLNLATATQEATNAIAEQEGRPQPGLQKVLAALQAMKAELGGGGDGIERAVSQQVKAHSDRSKLQHRRQLKSLLDEMGPKMEVLRKECVFLEGARRVAVAEPNNNGSRHVTAKAESVIALLKSAGKTFELLFPHCDTPTAQRAKHVAKTAHARGVSPEKVARQVSRTPSGAATARGVPKKKRSNSPSISFHPSSARRSHSDLTAFSPTKVCPF